MPLSKQLKGIFGVHYTAAQLAKNGILPAVTSRNVETIDIIVSNEKGTKSVTIQVKTKSPRHIFNIVTIKGTKSDKEMIKTIERKIRPDESKFYAFVCLNQKADVEEYYMVPSQQVLDMVQKERKEALETPYKRGPQKGKKRIDTGGPWQVKREKIPESYKGNKGIKKIKDALNIHT